jgi:hypothetical protein
MAEYADEDALLHAIAVLRERGWTRLEAYTPHVIRHLDRALGAPKSRLSWIVAVAGVLGAAGGYFLQWWLNAYLYPVDAGNRPAHMPLAYVPITFEMGVLCAGITAFVCVFVMGRLVKLWHPVFETPGFDSATRGGYWLAIDGRDPRFDLGRAQRDLGATDPVRMSAIEGTP